MPDFGIMRGFGAKLFSDKLMAGQLPTQLGKIGSEDFGFDADFLAFYNRVITAGGSLSALEQLATDQLVKDLKSYLIWTKMKAIYPMVGASAAACAQNLKSSSFTGTFNGGWTFASTGVTPNGTNGYMNTGFNPLSHSNINSAHLSIYQNTNISAIVLMGVKITSSFQLAPLVDTLDYNNLNSTDSGISTGYTRLDSFIMVNRTNNLNSQSWYKNNKLYTKNQSAVDLNNGNVYISGRNNGSNAVFVDSNTKCFASIGDGLTDTEASNFYTAVQAFQTTLSRQV